jgi:hypothetical protein
MIDPAGPFLFDTSAESWLGRATQSADLDWMREYLSYYQVNISAVSVMERVRGYSLLWRRADRVRRDDIEAARVAYLNNLGMYGRLTEPSPWWPARLWLCSRIRPRPLGDPIAWLNPGRNV